MTENMLSIHGEFFYLKSKFKCANYANIPKVLMCKHLWDFQISDKLECNTQGNLCQNPLVYSLSQDQGIEIEDWRNKWRIASAFF